MRHTSKNNLRVKVFLRNFFPLTDLECSLREMLESTAYFIADLQEQNIDSNADTFIPRGLSDTRFRGGKSLILVVMNSDSLTTRQPTGSSSDCLTEMQEPYQIRTLLDCGVSDFIVPPFKPIDVNVRVKRTSS